MRLPVNAEALAEQSTVLTSDRRRQILEHIRASDNESDQTTAAMILKNGGLEAEFLKDLAARAAGSTGEEKET